MSTDHPRPGLTMAHSSEGKSRGDASIAIADLTKQRDDFYQEIQRAQAIINDLTMWREAWLTRPRKSTPEMRARIRELAAPIRDDFDRAVVAVVDDVDAEDAARNVYIAKA